MNLQITDLPFGARPNPPHPNSALLEILGEDGIRQMINDHYNLLVKSNIKHLFPPDGPELDLAKQNSADFFIQRLGGPDYFNQNRGKPLLTQRHQPFSITPEGRVTWLNCYKEVLTKLSIPEEVIIAFWEFIDIFSIWMVNTAPKSINIDPESIKGHNE